MIWILRKISVHLWLTTLIAIPLNFSILRFLTTSFPGINPVTSGVSTIVGVALILGFLMNRMAHKTVISLLKEGQAWERSGILNRAEKKYMKALRIYDTYLFWPLSARKTARLISGAIAKFKLNTGIDNPNFRLGTAVYLKLNPGDENIIPPWLDQLNQSTRVTLFEQEVLSLLAEKHINNKSLLILMVDIFIRLERRDFIARKLYQNVRNDFLLEKKYAQTIENLMGWPDGRIQKQDSFSKPSRRLETRIQIGRNIELFAQNSVTLLKSIWTNIRAVLTFIILSVGKKVRYIKENERARFYVKTGFTGLVVAGFLFFMINTISHMFQWSPMPKSGSIETKKAVIEVQVPKPFTIQVAAYLKLKHAETYVGELKKKGIDAGMKKVDGGGKTWFVVRVSQFTDKQSAAAYGQELKQQNVIEDFFVNNR